MSGVEFDTERQAMLQKMQQFQGGTSSSSRFAQWLVNKGIVSSEAAAHKVLIALVLANIIITIIVIKAFIL